MGAITLLDTEDGRSGQGGGDMGSGGHGPEAPELGPEPAAPAGGWPAFDAAEVAKHCTVDDAWVAVAGSVYDITAFASTHPGWYRAGKVSTALAIARNLGQDCTVSCPPRARR